MSTVEGHGHFSRIRIVFSVITIDITAIRKFLWRADLADSRTSDRKSGLLRLFLEEEGATASIALAYRASKSGR